MTYRDEGVRRIFEKLIAAALVLFAFGLAVGFLLGLMF